jgi:hypothetical protein
MPRLRRITPNDLTFQLQMSAIAVAFGAVIAPIILMAGPGAYSNTGYSVALTFTLGFGAVGALAFIGFLVRAILQKPGQLVEAPRASMVTEGQAERRPLVPIVFGVIAATVGATLAAVAAPTAFGSGSPFAWAALTFGATIATGGVALSVFTGIREAYVSLRAVDVEVYGRKIADFYIGSYYESMELSRNFGLLYVALDDHTAEFIASGLIPRHREIPARLELSRLPDDAHNVSLHLYWTGEEPALPQRLVDALAREKRLVAA